MSRSIFLLFLILITINLLAGDMIPRGLRQDKTIMISGEQINKEVVDKALARIKQRMEELCFWGDYEKNQEVHLRLIYTFADVLGKKALFVLFENKRKEKEIWPFHINGNNVNWEGDNYFLDNNNETIVNDENNKEIGHKFFENDALKATIKIEGTYSIPPMKVVTDLQKKEVECVKEFVKTLIKDNGWENKFPDGQVPLWMTVTQEEVKDLDFVHVDFFIENGKGWGFGADLRLNKERTKCEFDNMRFSERTVYRAPDFVAEKMKTYYHKEIIKLGMTI